MTHRKRRPRRLLWVFGFLLLAIGLTGWFAPTIVAISSLRDQILPTVLPDAKANFTIGSASLGWLSPVRLSGVEARDAEGNTLLTAENVTTDKTLWELAGDQVNLGTLTITGLAAYIDLRDGGSNIEDAFGPLLESSDDSPPIHLNVNIQGGKIELHDLIAQRGSRIDITQATVALTPGNEVSLEAKADGSIIDESVNGKFQLAYTANSIGTNQLRVATDGAPLRPLAGVLRRAIGPSDIAGLLSGDVNVAWSDSANSPIEIAGQAHARQLQLAAAKWLGGDVLRSDAVSYSGTVRLADQRIIADNVTLAADHGKIAVHGAVHRVVPGEAASGASLRDTLMLLAKEDLQASGEIDLARLAAALPNTLRIRDDTTITGGSVTFNVDSQTTNNERAWKLHLESSNITANSAGQAVAWNQPIVVQAAAHQTPTGPVIDQLTCQADFMQVTGQGDLNNATLTARADLTALAGRLGQFVDLRDIALAGTVDLGVRLLRDADTQIVNVVGGGQLTNLQVVAPGAIAIREPNLQIELGGALATSADFTNIVANSGQVKLTAGEDTCIVRIAQPVAITNPTTGLPLRIEGGGRLNTWAARLQSVLPLDDWKLQGDIAFAAAAELLKDEIRIATSECDINNLVASGNGHDLREQMIRLTATGSWSSSAQRLTATAATLASTSWSLRGDDLVVQLLPQGPPTVNGRLAYRSDIRRTIASLRSLREVPTTGVRGIATGNVLLATSNGVTTLDVVSQVENLVLDAAPRAPTVSVVGVRTVTSSQATQTLWTERQLNIGGRIVYVHATDTLQLPQLTAETSGAKLTCSGELTAISTAPRANLTGEATYNLAAMMHRLRPLLGDQIQFIGSDKATFALHGPLVSTPLAASQPNNVNAAAPVVPAISPELQASAGFAWEKAALYGLPIGPGQLQGELRAGVLDFKPMSLDVSGGKFNIAPRFYLNETPAVMTLDRGQLLENVELTPQMCRTWLKFVAPLLGDATECQGRVSMQIERAVLPIDNPATGSLAGTLTIHGADVRPGPLANSYINLLRRLQGALQGSPPEADSLAEAIRLVRLEEQDLVITMVDGRVHHQGLTMRLGDATVITSGSVGADQSLDLIAEIPVQDAWIEGRSYLLGLQGQSLKVPVKGTVSRPQIDNSIIQELGRKTLGGAATSLFRNEINGLLGEMIKPPDQRAPRTDANGLPPVPDSILRKLLPPEIRQPPAQQPPPQTTP